MGLILDTNALSAVAEGEAAALEELARANEIAIPVIVLGVPLRNHSVPS